MGTFSLGGFGAFFFIWLGIIAATVYFATKYAFVPAINKLRGEVTSRQQTFAIYIAGGLIAFFVFPLLIVLAAGAFLYTMFSKKT